MSQQINLLLAELRPRRDWFALPAVVAAAVGGLVLVAGVAAWGNYQVRSLAGAAAQSEANLKALQQQLQALAHTLGARQPDPALPAEIESLNESLRQRAEALLVLEGDRPASAARHAALMRGFARQIMDGVWLTGFSASGDGVEIHGRLSDPALLPQYIRRLNGEAAFQGRRFSALDMRDGSAGPAAAPTALGAAAQSSPRYTEFALRGNPAKGEEKVR